MALQESRCSFLYFEYKSKFCDEGNQRYNMRYDGATECPGDGVLSNLVPSVR